MYKEDRMLPMGLIEWNFDSSQGFAVEIASIHLVGLHLVAFFCNIVLSKLSTNAHEDRGA